MIKCVRDVRGSAFLRQLKQAVSSRPFDERRWAVIGRTETGRVLVVVFTDADLSSAS
jgi:uncharacterized DUF497 family protein